jgi:transposase-like protein
MRETILKKNYRNGYSKKNIKTSFGEVELDIPRDRNAEFVPKVVKKYETVCNKLDKKDIGLYSIGVYVDDIQAEIHDLYWVDISPAMISKITNKVIETVIAWQNRPLEAVYPRVYMDAVHFKVKEEHKIVSKAAYICMALEMKRYKDILGIWVGEHEVLSFGYRSVTTLKTEE